MNIKEVKEMINLMKENDLVELEIEKDGYKLRLKKGGSGIIAHEEFVSIPKLAVSSKLEAAPQAEAQKAAVEENYHIIRSPMVGTFYAAPAPDQDPYVRGGQNIKEDDVLCIIEAMKLMNEIKSDVSGKVVEILVDNGRPVEFDQPLFKIDLKG